MNPSVERASLEHFTIVCALDLSADTWVCTVLDPLQKACDNVVRQDRDCEQSGQPEPPIARILNSWFLGGGPVTAVVRRQVRTLEGKTYNELTPTHHPVLDPDRGGDPV